ncbi:16S rRNA m(7)G-527 methyltransferase [Solirubrobacter pauli]|uniref:Ribosomal RNA small subunit methyltransferase G n=1 Tax=Solirubrobacter pauli TaxID=166793 RepID=A0A660LE21_9ACTN|nr:16S rRNA (guanine(527)-N(7))-methyltransferase RsmG [Solirubrobacter pauli]RKQ92445.1 16S rRNA m(7)G-527 methyltransferase [Solirubrobacter pauli]
MKRLEDVAPAHAVDALARILGFQSIEPTASTTVRDPAEAVGRHVGDSLSALALPEVADARRIADLGSGAGWPGLALAAALPDAHVWLVESAIRHCRYLEQAVDIGELANVTVVHARIEEWSGEHDLVTARALAALAVLVEYAAPLLELGGHFVAWKGAVSDDEDASGLRAAEIVGLERTQILPVVPYDGARDHTLHVFRKVRPTPTRFPRRAGMATKRPLA